MIDWNCCKDKTSTAAWFIGAVGATLIVGGLAWLIVSKALPPGIDEERAALRTQNLAEARATDAEALTTYAWVDQTKGIVRLPIERAMELSLALGKDPTAGRENLLERLAVATAAPPEEENPYE